MDWTDCGADQYTHLSADCCRPEPQTQSNYIQSRKHNSSLIYINRHCLIFLRVSCPHIKELGYIHCFSYLLQLSKSRNGVYLLGHVIDGALSVQAQVPVEIEEQRLAGPHVHLISHKEELNLQAPLVVATLRAILGFSDAAFRRHLKEFFPILTQLISCEHAPTEVQRTLTEIFATRFGPLLQAG